MIPKSFDPQWRPTGRQYHPRPFREAPRLDPDLATELPIEGEVLLIQLRAAVDAGPPRPRPHLGDRRRRRSRQMQRMYLPLIEQQRPLKPWEKPWEKPWDVEP